MTPHCETARLTLSSDSEGRDWEHFWLDQRYQFSNQIPDLRSFTNTHPGLVIADRGLCVWQYASPALPEQAISGTAANLPPATQAAAVPPTGGDGAIGLLLVLGLAGSAVWAWFNKGQGDHTDGYHPMADCPGLPPAYTHTPLASQGHSTDRTPEELPDELPGHSGDFEGSSEGATDELPNELPQSDWPPKTMGAPYDALLPEQPGEFERYRRAIEADGLNSRGNDILKVVWGVTPGRSRAYQAARKRRDEFAKRLDYYRYEAS